MLKDAGLKGGGPEFLGRRLSNPHPSEINKMKDYSRRHLACGDELNGARIGLAIQIARKDDGKREVGRALPRVARRRRLA